MARFSDLQNQALRDNAHQVCQQLGATASINTNAVANVAEAIREVEAAGLPYMLLDRRGEAGDAVGIAREAGVYESIHYLAQSGRQTIAYFGADDRTRLDGYERAMQLLGLVPVASAVMGATAGGPAGRAVMSHFSVMVRGTSQFFAAGPPVVERALSKKISKEELGGAHIAVDHAGAIDNAADSEAEAFAQIKRFLSYMPQNVWQMPPYVSTDDPVDRWEEELLSIVPRNRMKPYDMRRIIELVFDRSSFFEIQPTYGLAAITGLARLNGYPVGIVANNPRVNAGAPDAQDSNKIGHFCEVCDQFHIPLVFLVDVPGFMIGPKAEAMGTLRAGMRAMHVGMQATVPRFTVIIRKCYGMAGALNYVNDRLCYRIAWPSAEFGSIPIEGGVAAAFKREIEGSDDPDKRRAEIESEIRSYESPFRTAEAFGVEDIIDPRETRSRLCHLIEAAQNYLETELGPTAKSGVRP